MKDEDIKHAMSPEYQAMAEERELRRQQYLPLLPALRKARKEALARGDHAEAEQLEKQ